MDSKWRNPDHGGATPLGQTVSPTPELGPGPVGFEPTTYS